MKKFLLMLLLFMNQNIFSSESNQFLIKQTESIDALICDTLINDDKVNKIPDKDSITYQQGSISSTLIISTGKITCRSDDVVLTDDMIKCLYSNLKALYDQQQKTEVKE